MAHNDDASKNDKKSYFKPIAILVLVVFILIGVIASVKGTGEKPVGIAVDNASSFEPTDVSLEYDYDSKASFYSYDSDDFYFCTKDGMEYIDSSGKVVWKEVFTMTDPIMVGECSNVAVAEPDGNVLYAFSPEGMLFTKQFSGTILNFSINSTGTATVILKMPTGYETQVIDSTGEFIWGFKHVEENVFPVCADISNDNRIVAISLLNINNVNMQSSVMFAYVDEEEAKDYTDTIFGSVECENQIVASLQFLEEDNLVYFSDTEIGHVSFGEEGVTQSSQTIEAVNEIDYFGATGDKGFVSITGDNIPNKENLPPGLVQIYDDEFTLTGEYDLGKKATYLSSSNDENVVVGVNRAYFAINNKGKLLWKHNATQDYKQVILLGDPDTVLFASNTGATVMKRTS